MILVPKYFCSDPNLGETKSPITLNKVASLPKWPKFTYSKREYLDMESLSRMIIKNRLRETYCSFWKDPEGFTKRQATSMGVKYLVQVLLVAVVSYFVISYFVTFRWFYTFIFSYVHWILHIDLLYTSHFHTLTPL